ncbi:hypothetical protein ACFY4B_27385 [Kitasatospora sp. NPDC001261]|uniref:hypothetical protein n=1 Tax=Kitasatospora sp. NPDC001261 TaxID=3364012 RepID=UPI0036B22207
MGARAITEWHEHEAGPSMVDRNPWLSPVTMIPALADYLHHTTTAGRPPSASGFRAWATEHLPAVLGTVQTEGPGAFLGAGTDIQFHYLVQQSAKDPGTLRIAVRERERRTWTLTAAAHNADELFALAAKLLHQQARNIRRLRTAGRGGPMPDPEEIEQRAEQIRARITPAALEAVAP